MLTLAVYLFCVLLVQSAESLSNIPEASLARFFCGLMAGTLAKLATHPLDVAKKRFQVVNDKPSEHLVAALPRQLASILTVS